MRGNSLGVPNIWGTLLQVQSTPSESEADATDEAVLGG